MKSLLTKYRALIFLCALLNLPACLLHAQKEICRNQSCNGKNSVTERAVEDDDEQEDDDDNAKYRRWEWWAEQQPGWQGLCSE